MKPEDICALFLAASFLEFIDEMNDTTNLEIITDFLKICEASRHQDISFGHFKNIIENSSENVQNMYQNYVALFLKSYIMVTKEITEEMNRLRVNHQSPLGIIVYDNLHALDITPIFAIAKITTNFMNWITNTEINAIPLLLEPDYVFNKKPLPTILSPLPSYSSTTLNEADLEKFLRKYSDKSPQALLYLALKHSNERKTSLALEEASSLCLSMSKSNDESIKSRSSVALSQIYNEIGLKDDSVLAINESIDGSKNLDDPSILSTAVAMKAILEDTPELWKHAANLADPHPQSTVHAALSDENGLVKALKTKWPYVAASVYASLGKEDSARFAECFPPVPKYLPIIVESMLSYGNWAAAASLMMQFDVGFTEVRATAIATCALFSDLCGFTEAIEYYREELDEILQIDIGHFSDVKKCLRRIADMWRANVSDDSIISSRNILMAAKWAVNSANSAERIVAAARFANSIHAYSLNSLIIEKAQKYGVEIELNAAPEDLNTFDCEIMIRKIGCL